MQKNEFKDRLFDVINDTDNLPIQDITVDDKQDMMNVYLTDGTRFSILNSCRKMWNMEHL